MLNAHNLSNSLNAYHFLFPKVVEALEGYHSPCQAIRIDDYRPISMLHPVSKALEKLMRKQVTDFFVEFGPLNGVQSGLRAKHSGLSTS